jgi:hypothetical protein
MHIEIHFRDEIFISATDKSVTAKQASTDIQRQLTTANSTKVKLNDGSILVLGREASQHSAFIFVPAKEECEAP